MKFIPIGIASEKEFRKTMNAADFSDEHYEGVQLREDKKDRAVLIMRNRKESPMEWKIVYGFSSVFFDSLEEAVDYCEKHGMKLLKGER